MADHQSTRTLQAVQDLYFRKLLDCLIALDEPSVQSNNTAKVNVFNSLCAAITDAKQSLELNSDRQDSLCRTAEQRADLKHCIEECKMMGRRLLDENRALLEAAASEADLTSAGEIQSAESAKESSDTVTKSLSGSVSTS